MTSYAVGQFVESSVVSAISVTNPGYTTLTSITLSEGDWDVFANAIVILQSPTDITVENILAGGSFSQTSFTGLLGKEYTAGGGSLQPNYNFTMNPSVQYPIQIGSQNRIVYLLIHTDTAFTGGTVQALGYISARRRR